MSDSERRKQPRNKNNFSIFIEEINRKPTQHPYKGEIIDITKNGIGFKTDAVFKLNQNYFIKINQKKHNSKLNLEVLVLDNLKKDDSIRYCCSILPTKYTDTSLLEKFLMSLKKDKRNCLLDEDRVQKYGEISNRLNKISEKTGVVFKDILDNSIPESKVVKNIENYIGVAKIPIGIGGPIQVNGKYAKGKFYVPFATTEGTLVETYTYGMRILNMVGGVNVELINDQLDITPVFILDSLLDAKKFSKWAKKNYNILKQEAEKTTTHGKIKDIIHEVVGRRVYLTFVMDTGDAMGLNMINIATANACKYIIENYKGRIDYFLRSNYSSDKKPSSSNLMKCYGKKLIAEAVIPKKYISRFFRTTPEEIFNFYYSAVIGSVSAGMIGFNGHYANGLAAIYIACGQDVAQVVNASIGVLNIELINGDDLYISIKTPSIIVGTVGGGTSLPTQNECLQIMGCAGSGKAKKFSEIISSTLLAGELTLCATLSCNKFIKAHEKKRTINLEKILNN